MSPQRDFQKVANSITREAIPAGMFNGKAKQLYDCLYSLTRGAIAPSMSVRISRAELMKKSGIGSKVTLEQNLRRLIAAGLVNMKTIGGIQGGNEYTINLPEEAAILSTPPSTGTSPPSGGQKLGALAPLETRGPSRGLNVAVTGTSIAPNTSFKTNAEKTDDEAYAGLINSLKLAVKEVTGKDSPPAEAERWREVGELLVAELRQGALRTSVSSAPAFLAELLRRKLSRQPAAQPTAKTAIPAPVPPVPEPEPPSDEDLILMFVNFLHNGMSIEEIDSQFSASVERDRWPTIRQAALERYETEKAQVQPPTDFKA